MIQLWHIWVIIALICFIIGIFTSGFAVGCFSIGALVAAVGCVCHVTLIWQMVIFAVFSFIAFVYLRPLIAKNSFKSTGDDGTNADALVGRKGLVTQDIDPSAGYGRVVIDGREWKAFSQDGEFIPRGSKVEVVKQVSTIVVVSREND